MSLDKIRSALQNIVLNLAASRFTWHGLPDDIPPFYVERMLTKNGMMGMFKTHVKVGENLVPYSGVLPVAGVGVPNIYGMQDRYQVVSVNGKLSGKTFRFDTSAAQMSFLGEEFEDLIDGDNKDEFVLLGNNPEFVSEMDIINYCVDQIVELMSTYAVNVRAIKMPTILVGDLKMKNSFITQYNQLAGGAPYIFIDGKQIAKYGDPLQARDTNLSDGNLKVLSSEIDYWWRLMLQKLGIKTVNEEKKERMVVDEANAVQAEVDNYVNYRLETRLAACRMANERGVFEEEVTVKPNINYQSGDLNAPQLVQEGNLEIDESSKTYIQNHNQQDSPW